MNTGAQDAREQMENIQQRILLKEMAQSKILTTLSDKAKRVLEGLAYDKAQSEETIATKLLEAILSDPVVLKLYADDIAKSQLSCWNSAKNPNNRK